MDVAEVWIEAEHWAPGVWQPANDVTDAIVTLRDGSRWIGTFCAFDHVAELRANCAENGECLGGRYLWASDLILIDDTLRPTIEAVVRDLLVTGELPSAMSAVDASESESDAV
jgi:hypothetical protein